MKYVSVLMSHGAPWWVAKDVCTTLGITDTSDAVKKLRPHEKDTAEIPTLGGPQHLLVINEAGLYRLIFRSNKPDAQRFQDWVFGEVPSSHPSNWALCPDSPRHRPPSRLTRHRTISPRACRNPRRCRSSPLTGPDGKSAASADFSWASTLPEIGTRVCCAEELEMFMKGLPGTTAEEAVAAVEERRRW